tara:strand:+ start:131 stop:658 length:528 start_codon:yes stop_codon:yes gene_type:complete
MKFKNRVITLSFALVIVVSCSSTLTIQSDSDTQYDLTDYKTYKIISPELENKNEMISLNPILIQRISRSLDSVLSQKGLTKSDSADVSVKFYLGTKREIERSSDLGSYGYYGYRYLESRDQRYIRSDKDEISIRFHDAKTDDVVWYAFTRFKRPSDQYDQAGIDTLIKEVLSSFN